MKKIGAEMLAPCLRQNTGLSVVQILVFPCKAGPGAPETPYFDVVLAVALRISTFLVNGPHLLF